MEFEEEQEKTDEQIHTDFEVHIDKIIGTILTYVIKEDIEADRAKVLQALQNTRYLWAEAFVAESRSTINYERLENLGDSFAKCILLEILHKTFQRMTPDQATNMMNYFVTNKFQGKILDDFTAERVVDVKYKGGNGEDAWDVVEYIPGRGVISDLLLTDTSISHEIKIDLRQDLYESVFAAIKWTGDSVAPGLGWLWCERLTYKVFKPYLNEESFNKFSKSYTLSTVEQIFNRFKHGSSGISAPYVNSYITQLKPGRSQQTTQLIIGEGALQFFKNEQIRSSIKDSRHRINFDTYSSGLKLKQVFQEATTNNKEESETAVATQSLEFLEERFGITTSWARAAKDAFDLELYSHGRDSLKYNVGIIRNADDDIVRYGTMYANAKVQSPYTIVTDSVNLKQAVYKKLITSGYEDFEIVKNQNKGITGNRTILFLNGRTNDDDEIPRRLTGIAGDGDSHVVKRELFEKYIGLR